MIVGRTMWTQSTSVTDRQTDGQTDRITMTKTAQRIASRGKKNRTRCEQNIPTKFDYFIKIPVTAVEIENLFCIGNFRPHPLPRTGTLHCIFWYTRVM